MNDIKTVLLHCDSSPDNGRRLRLVKELAARLGACVESVYAVMPMLMQYPFALAGDGGVAAQLAACEAETRRTVRTAFARDCEAAGMADVTWHETLGDPVQGFGRHAWGADLLVFGQRDPASGTEPGVPADFAASVLLATGKPGLVLPYVDAAPGFGSNVLVAWKATPESARALGAALPLLQRADQVHLACWDDPQGGAAEAALAPLRFLKRHGVAAVAHHESAPARDIGEALLSRAADLRIDLLVMGCYGHGRAREWALGGVTRTVMQSMTVPVLMVH
jgi:nucleotide-binding universal stress UspA family protein